MGSHIEVKSPKLMAAVLMIGARSKILSLQRMMSMVIRSCMILPGPLEVQVLSW